MQGYEKFLGPTADQALNPFPKGVEQNAGEKKVCTLVETAKYKALYKKAYGKPIDCRARALHKSFQRLAVALAAWQESDEVVPFDSRRDQALDSDDDGQFPLVDFSPDENAGHDLFYGRARCSGCHNGLPGNFASDDSAGVAPEQLYTDHLYHNIGVPYNREIPGVPDGEKKGLVEHTGVVLPGFFKTPTLRNVAKGLDKDGRGKAFFHNGYLKDLESLVHFYNTRDAKPPCAIPNNPHPTAAEAIAGNCWPKPEFDNAGKAVFVVGNLGLSKAEELQIVAYLKTLSDTSTPSPP